VTARTSARLVAVYADESCLGNGRDGDNPGGAGGVIEVRRQPGGELTRRDYWVSEPSTTNNRMALRSAIHAFEILSRFKEPPDVVFTSDSRYLVDGMSAWVRDWIRRGWRRKSGSIENLALWQQLVAAARGYRTEWRWVRGHVGHAQNEYANHLAMRAAREQTQALDPVPSAFEAWLSALEARAGRGGVITPAPFPDRRGFRPAPPLPPEVATSLF